MLDMHLPQISKLLKEDLLNTLHVCNQLQDVGEVSLMFQGINRSRSFKLVKFTTMYLFLSLLKEKFVFRLGLKFVAYIQTLCNKLIQDNKLIF